MAVCTLCPRRCGVDRHTDVGYCRMSKDISVSKAYLHMWEEPCISGTNGSGAVFFDGCNLRCIYCQNSAISQGSKGNILAPEQLSDVFMNLQTKGAHNINLVTPTHFADKIARAIDISRKNGLGIPTIYNTGGYECKETLEMLKKQIDIYLPDFKYMDQNAAQKYSYAQDYPQVAKKALEEMVRQKPKVKFDKNDIALEGVIVRHLLLPGNLKNSKAVIEFLYKTYGDNIYISIMSQYTPMEQFKEHPELSETVSRREYEKLVDYALSLGVTNAYVQDMTSSGKKYIPDFDMV